MSASKPFIPKLLDFLDNSEIDDYLLMVSNHDFTDDEVTTIDKLLNTLRDHEGKLRRVRQMIEYKVRHHRLEKFKKRS